MSAMTKRNAESAGQAKSLVDRAGMSVQKSNTSMASLVTSMAEISRMGEETGKIIKTIDEIAFQTNLLALNAAVEAARAGEAGAGFAVVADEVRNLAQRAAGAAKNTSELIEGTIKKIKDGTVLVEKTNVDFSEVASAVTKVTELVGEISAASSEQSRGIDEVSTAIGQMDKVTQGNAANAEEIASASEELSAQALSMEDIVRGLDSLVKGEGNVTSHTASQAAPPARRKVTLPVRAAQPPIGKTARAALGGGKPAGGNGKHPGSNGKTHPAQNPEDLIPLEEKSMAEF
jgi:methyl-accepting chemotaxis protein